MTGLPSRLGLRDSGNSYGEGAYAIEAATLYEWTFCKYQYSHHNVQRSFGSYCIEFHFDRRGRNVGKQGLSEPLGKAHPWELMSGLVRQSFPVLGPLCHADNAPHHQLPR
jgi:hypothetical protein